MNPINKILLGIGAAIALVIIIAFIWLSLANAHLRADLAEARGSEAACHLANDTFAEATLKQNKAVAVLQAQASLREKRARTDSYRAQLAARKWFLDAALLEKQKIAGDECAAATQFFDRYRMQK